MELTWSRPRRLADGTALFSLQGFRIERSRSNGLFEHLSAVLVEDRDRFRQVRRFRYLDRTATPGEVFAYRVSSFTVDGELSAPSNTVEIVAAVPEAEGTPTPESAP